MPRLIAHIDMDAFYASVELLRYPELRGRAVVIGGGRASQPRLRADGTREFSALRDYVGRGVVTTSTYEARKFGVFSAMGMMKSAVLAPHAVLLPVDFDEYRKYSRLFKSAVREIAPLVEDRGIDEIYADLSELPGVHDDGGRAVGLNLKAAVRERTGLTCSIGITPNKLLSKIASELDKPDGLTLLGHADIAAARLAAGGAQGQRHRPEGGGEARRLRPEHDRRHRRRRSGVPGRALRQELRRLAARGFARPRRARHRHRERAEVDQPRDHLRAQPARGARPRRARRDPDRSLRRARRRPGEEGLRRASTLGIKLRFDDFKIATRDLTLPAHTWGAREIRNAAGQCLKRVDLSRRLRLIGVRASALARLADLVAPLASADPPAAAAGGARAAR